MLFVFVFFLLWVVLVNAFTAIIKHSAVRLLTESFVQESPPPPIINHC